MTELIEAVYEWLKNMAIMPRIFITADIQFSAPVERLSSSDDVCSPPNLYFDDDNDEGKEKKYTSYEELRKKHRERWTPPNISSVTTRRMEQVSKVNNFRQN